MSTLRYADIPIIQNLINKIRGALNTKQDIIQYNTFPTNNASLIGIIAQYTGTSTEQYKQGRFYMCKQNPTDESIVWEEVNKIDTYDVLQCTHDQYDEMDELGEIPDGTLVLFTDSTTDATPTENSTNYVTSGGVYAAIYTKQDTMQFNTMPTASAEFSGKIIQYVGVSDSTYINGYFYKCIREIVDENEFYSWEIIRYSPTVDSAISSSSTNPVQNKVIKEELDTKVDKAVGKGLSTFDFNNTYKTAVDTNTSDIANLKLNKADKTEIKNGELTIKRNDVSVGTFTANSDDDVVININVPVSASDVSALPNSTKYAASVEFTINASTYVMTLTLKDQNGDTLGTPQTVDLPLESMVVGGSYDDTNKKIILTLKNNNTVDFPVGALISGLQSEITSANKLSADLVDDTNSTNKFISAAEKLIITELQNDVANIKASHVELTQAEYDALGNEKYSDNKEYFITDGDIDKPIIYGFCINQDESDPDDRVVYLKDAVGMTPASMGSTSFNYGSWQNVFFMSKPCMLKYDGTVDYYLDPNDYSKKIDGTPSDISDPSYNGNVMVEWPLIWYKFEYDENKNCYFYVSNKKVDDTYHCWCNYDCNNNIIEHFYNAAYNGTATVKYNEVENIENENPSTNGWYECENGLYFLSTDTEASSDKVYYTKVIDNSKLRSLSGVQLISANGNGNTSGAVEAERAVANNTTDKIEWYTDVLSDYQLITMLLVLIGKSTNIQAKFGRGLDTGGQSAKEAYATGTLNDKGLFWGDTANGTSAVKVFGIENFYGCVWHRVAGMVGTNNKYKVKLTHGTIDGSTAEGFNSDGTGYIDLDIDQPAANGYIKYCTFTDYGFVPTDSTGSSTTFYADYDYRGTGYLLMGGSASNGVYSGPFCVNLNRGFLITCWYVSAFLSCKPLARRG